MATERLKILLVAAEVTPFAKVGGLADVAGALPKALKALGHDVRIVMPCYKMIETNPDYGVEDVLPPFPVPAGAGSDEQAFVKRTRLHSHYGTTGGKRGSDQEIPVYLLGNVPPKRAGESHPGFFQQTTSSKKVYSLQASPYSFFCRAVLEMLPRLAPEWMPDVLHCNDWHTGLIPAYQRTLYPYEPAVSAPAALFTIHNLAYHGTFPRDQWPLTGLPESLYDVRYLEFYGGWSFMKSGLVFSDRVNTVSEHYAQEIQTFAYGGALAGLMEDLYAEGKLSGIINGIDYETLDPATDPHIPCHYSADDPAGKAQCKAALQAELGLPASRDTAVLGMVTRLAEQKGLDLLRAVADDILALPVQFVLLGVGDPFYEKYFKRLQTRYPRQVHARIDFDPALAQRIYAGSDLFLMPSRFEPCGLGQLIAMRYGTIPIVRATGGLADTVHDFDPAKSPEGNGFVFAEFAGSALKDAVRRGVAAFEMGTHWDALVQRALRADSSWTRSAEKYVALYREALAVRSRMLPGLR